jgi:hypothetical protein
MRKLNALATFQLGFMYVNTRKQLICVTAIKGDAVNLEYLGTNLAFTVNAFDLKQWIDNGVLMERPGQRDIAAVPRNAPKEPAA